MSYQLVAEVLDHAPSMTPAERLLLTAVAEEARVHSREADIDAETLQRRVGVDESGVRKVLRRLADRGLDVRVAVGKDKRGSPVYAHRGRVARYRLPVFPAPEGCVCRPCRGQKDGTVVTPFPRSEGGPAVHNGGPVGPPSGSEKGGPTVHKGGTVVRKGGPTGSQRRSWGTPHPSVVPPSGVLPDDHRTRASARGRAREVDRACPPAARAAPTPAAVSPPRVPRPPDWRAEKDARPGQVDPTINASGRGLCNQVLAAKDPGLVDRLRPPSKVDREVEALVAAECLPRDVVPPPEVAQHLRLAVGASSVPPPDVGADQGGRVLPFRRPR